MLCSFFIDIGTLLTSEDVYFYYLCIVLLCESSRIYACMNITNTNRYEH